MTELDENRRSTLIALFCESSSSATSVALLPQRDLHSCHDGHIGGHGRAPALRGYQAGLAREDHRDAIDEFRALYRSICRMT
jgi:hypothetical protein